MPDKGRHQARKRAVDLLFEAEARGITPAEVADARNALARTIRRVTAEPVHGDGRSRGDPTRRAHRRSDLGALQGWTLDRLPAVDRAILRVAVWELLHAKDVPEPVAVDEAVELAKAVVDRRVAGVCQRRAGPGDAGDAADPGRRGGRAGDSRGFLTGTGYR